MSISWGKFRRGLLALAPEETTYQTRGFRGATGDMRQRIEQIGATFLDGYHAALEEASGIPTLGTRLNSLPLEVRGFAFEGAAMGLGLLDWLTPWRRTRVEEFLAGPAGAHTYMVHVALGWVWARTPVNIARATARLDPLLGWLAFDGWGFHEGFFKWPSYISGQPRPRRLTGYSARVFDMGLGRSFWFVNGGNSALIAKTLAEFSPDRRPDLWSGIGLAATYAGFASADDLRKLTELAGPHRTQLAQGSAFAAKARQRAGNLTDYTELAAQTLCGLSAVQAALLTDETLENLPASKEEPTYEYWRRRVQARLSSPAPGLAAAACVG